MKFKLPWSKSEPEPVVVDVDEIRARARAEALEEATELIRASFASSPMMGAPGLTAQSPYPVYGYDHPIYYSTPQAPQRPPKSILTIDTLRRLADNYDVLRDCINHLKREVSAVPIDVKPKLAKDDSESTKARCDAALAFFSNAGGLGGFHRRRQHFEFSVIEDVCVVGASALFFSNTRGGALLEVIPIDAATIRPRADAFGFPGPGEAVYEQWIEGVLIGEYDRQAMSYDGIWPRTWTPYFASPVEWLVNVINSALRADDWNRTWLTDGNTPDTLIGAPESWSPAQIREYATYFDAIMAGDTKERQKAKIVPSGLRMQTATRKDQDFQEFELWLLRRTCAMMGVQPASIGFAGEQYKVSQTDSMESTSSFGVGTLLDFRKSLYDDILERLGYGDLEAVNINAREEKAAERATRNAALVGAGIKTVNEARKEEGLDAIDGGDMALVQNTMVSLAQAVDPPEPVQSDPNKVSGDPSKPSFAEPAKEQRAALAQWSRKAVSRIKDGKPALCDFASPAISTTARTLITEGLKRCETVADVKNLFSTATVLGNEISDRSPWAIRLIAELEELDANE